MYYFVILDELKKRKRLSANDIFDTLEKRGETPSIHGIRKTLLKMFVSINNIEREQENANTGGIKYFYFIKKTNI